MKSRNKKAAATRRAKPAAARKAPRSASRAKKSAPASIAKAPVVTVQVDNAQFDTSDLEASASAAPVAEVPKSAPTAAAASTSQRAGLKLESTFTLRDANDMLFQLLAVDFGDSDVLIDGGAVERIDTAGLQMLIAFAKHHTTRGKNIRWTAVSPELLRSTRLLGIAEPLCLSAHLNEGASGGH
jgi:phospholipid transport system transporter-binding protein